MLGTPTSLNQCNDVGVLPHADLSRWPATSKDSLTDFVNRFVNQGGWLYRSCHSVGDMDVNLIHVLSNCLIL